MRRWRRSAPSTAPESTPSRSFSISRTATPKPIASNCPSSATRPARTTGPRRSAAAPATRPRSRPPTRTRSTTFCCIASGVLCSSSSSSSACSKWSSPSASRSPTASATSWPALPILSARCCPWAGCNRSCSTAYGRAFRRCSFSSPRSCFSSSSSESSKTPAIWPAPL